MVLMQYSQCSRGYISYPASLELSVSVPTQHYVDHRKLFLKVLLDSDKYTFWYTEVPPSYSLAYTEIVGLVSSTGLDVI